jgi:hypothetical protein
MISTVFGDFDQFLGKTRLPILFKSNVRMRFCAQVAEL